MDASVLVVEDEPHIAEILVNYFKHEGFEVYLARDGELALQLWQQHQPDVILLDIMLPIVNGLDVLKKVRTQGNTAVILITAKAEEIDQVIGLELGADDYILKPFRPREVLARVRAVLRRTKFSTPVEDVVLRYDILELDTAQFMVKISGRKMDVTPTEFKLLHILIRYPERVFSRQELIEQAIPDSDALERVIDAHMMHLRQKLSRNGAGHLLQTVRGVGYKLGGI